MTRAWHQQVKRSPASARTDSDGSVFDSKAELKRWNELNLLQRAGEISGLERQFRLPLTIGPNAVKIRSARNRNGRQCFYTADFKYIKDDTLILEEFKGHDDEASRLRRAVAEAIYAVEIIVTGPAAKDTPRKVARA